MNEPTRFWKRRDFMASLAALAATSLTASARGRGLAASKKMKLGFDNFSVRAFDWQAPQLVQYAASLHVDTLLLSDLDVYESLEENYLTKIRAQAERVRVELQACNL